MGTLAFYLYANKEFFNHKFIIKPSELLIDPVRLQKAAEANPRRLLDPFADLGGDEKDDDDQTPALTDSFAEAFGARPV